jgi:two-component system, cell cycle sensor histidine kinase and response regulator CckA
VVALELRLRVADCGFSVAATAHDGDQAVKLAAATRPDVVLMDIRLGAGIDGIEAATRIRQSLDVPIVFLTAHSDASTLDRAAEVGPHAFLLKPFEDRLLRVTLELVRRRHVLETERRRAEARYAALVEQSRDAILTVDHRGRIVTANQEVERMFGRAPAGAMGRSLHWLLADESATAGWLDQVFASATAPVFAESVGHRATGESFPAEVSLAYLNLTDEDLAAIVVRDITELRELGAAKEQAEGALRQSRRIEALGRLAAGIAHDFNNVLAAIVISAEGIANDLSTMGNAQDVNEILVAAKRGSAMTRQLRAFGDGAVADEVTDVPATMSELLPMLRRLLGSSFELNLEMEDDVRGVRLDSAQLGRIITNLVLNARDACDSGGRIAVEVALTKPSAPNHIPEVRFVVRDTGIGMTKESIEHAFEPYFTTRRSAGGTGLGLSVVFGIATSAGGSVELESEEGKGTTVSVRLPSANLPSRPAATTEPAVVRVEATVLLVEDDPAFASAMRRALTAAGCSVRLASTAEEAIAYCESETQFDAIVTDIMLPGASGEELLAMLGTQNLQSRAAVIAMSGHKATLSEPSNARVFSGFLQKPFQTSDLLRLLARTMPGPTKPN